jgi:hypothetical protein
VLLAAFSYGVAWERLQKFLSKRAANKLAPAPTPDSGDSE